MLVLLFAMLALVGLGAIVFLVYLFVGSSRTRSRSREELMVEALRALGQLSAAAWQAERRMFLEAMRHIRSR